MKNWLKAVCISVIATKLKLYLIIIDKLQKCCLYKSIVVSDWL